MPKAYYSTNIHRANSAILGFWQCPSFAHSLREESLKVVHDPTDNIKGALYRRWSLLDATPACIACNHVPSLSCRLPVFEHASACRM